MDDVSNAMAKLSGVRMAVSSLLGPKETKGMPRQNWPPSEVAHYFTGAQKQLKTLAFELDDLYQDFPPVAMEPRVKMSSEGEHYYGREQLERLLRDIDQIFEIRANCELERPSAPAARAPTRRVFISHGRSDAWREVQAFVERDVKLLTLELAQEANLGRTIIEKLLDNSDACDSAVIVMTGDDFDETGQPRARENVMHEIGFFQGKYGRARVCMLHEEGVNIPTNLSGVVYIPFPKGRIGAGFHVLQRELDAIYRA